VQRAAELISGTLLAPGQEFDFDTVVGKRTPENGFTTAPAIVAGKLEDSLGGGICQVSTTLFNAVFFAGLDVTARTNHSIFISHYPTGRDATVSWGGPAFRFVNDTANWILIKSASSRSSVTFVLYGTPDGRQVSYATGDWYGLKPATEKRVKTDQLFEGQEQVIDDGQSGRSIKVTRKVTRDGSVIHDDTFVSRYPVLPKIIEVGTKPTTTTTTLPPTTTTTAPTTTTTTTNP
jgi:vancomycin resistance protein YoaR